jgi:ParB family chromosome partitioning protein
MTDNTTIPLNKLLAWEGNVRKTDADKGIDELAASITAHGLLQSLVVRKDKRGKYAVVAGRRRLLALKSLADAGAIKADMDIPCHVLDDEADATEISLAENVQREQMHPADEFDAFKALIDGGMPPADVAARFGVTETVVQKRLKLAKVSPKVIAAYRKGDLTLQHVMAFAVTDDHAKQERVFRELPNWQRQHPERIRNMLVEDEITSDDYRVKFVTLKAYENAGGTIRRDLFSEGEDGVFIQDNVLLESLVAKKLERTANKVRKEGWKWVEIRPTFEFEEWLDCGRRLPDALPLSPEEQSEFDALSVEATALSELDENRELDDDQKARFDVVSDRLDELHDRPEVWPPETLAIAGVVVNLGSDGKAEIHAGLIKPEDAPEQTEADAEDEVAATERKSRSPLPASLIENLTAQRSAALNAALLERPDVALAAAVHVMALQVFYTRTCDTVLQVTAEAQSLRRVEGSPAHDLIEKAREHWTAQLPGEPAELLPWCLAQDGDTLRGLLTFCAAQTVNAVLLKPDRPDCRRMQHAACLAEALHLDMGAWFTPTAANYFSRVNKAGILAALKEAKGDTAPAWEAMKKADLAALAERHITGTGWLPAPLRSPEVILAQTLEAAA